MDEEGEAGGLVLAQTRGVTHRVHRHPQLPVVSVVVLGLHLVEGEEALQCQLALQQGEVLLHHPPLLVTHLLPAGPPVEQVELRPGEAAVTIQVSLAVDIRQQALELSRQLYLGRPEDTATSTLTFPPPPPAHLSTRATSSVSATSRLLTSLAPEVKGMMVYLPGASSPSQLQRSLLDF